MKNLILSFSLAALASFCLIPSALRAQVPQLVNYQGRVAVGSVNFNGSGQFKFALVNTNGSTTYWSNDGTSAAGSEPTATVSLTVTKGLYSVLLGDTSLANMTAIPASVWTNADVRLRVWFNDGTNGSQLLSPDQRLAPSGYLPEGSVTSTKLAAGAVTATSIAPGSIGSGQLAAGTVAAPLGASGAVPAAANTVYQATGANAAVLTLPTTANVGDVVQVSGAGSGGWVVQPGSGQSVSAQWTAQNSAPNSPWSSVASSADGSHLAAASAGYYQGGQIYGQIYTSTNYGITWTRQSASPYALWLSLNSSPDGTHLIALAQAGGPLYVSADSGVTWTKLANAPANANLYSLASSADGTFIAVGGWSGYIYASSDSGATWTTQTSGLPAGINNWASLACSSDGSHLLAANNGEFLYTSTNFGASWTARSNGLPSLNSSPNWIAVASSSDGTHLAACNGGGQIYTSADAGATWTARTGAPAANWAAITSSADGTHLAAAIYSGAIYLSGDSGATWTAQSAPTSASWISIASSADGAHLVASTSEAVAGSGQLYTSGISGAQGSTATLQYLGGGQWTPVNQTQIAAGAVGTSQLAPQAVQTGNIAPGAIGSYQIAANAIQSNNIANGAVGYAQLGYQAVTTSKIAPGSIEANHFDGHVIGSDQLRSDLSLSGSTNGSFFGTFSGNGSALTNLSAAALSAGGTLPQLSGTNLLNLNAQQLTGTLSHLDGSALYNLNAASIAANGSLPVLNGFNLANLNASNITSGTLNNAATTATSGNAPNTIVLRDPTGNFSAGTITATFNGTFTGNGAALTNLTAANIAAGSTLPTLNGSNLTNLTAANITPGGTLPALNGSALTNISVPSTGNYFFGYSTASQSVTTSFATVTIGATVQSNGWTISNSTLTVPVTGLYQIQYNAHASVVSGGTVSLRAFATGVGEIAGSQSAGSMNGGGQTPISQTFIANLTSGTILSFQCAGSTTGQSLAPLGQGGTTPCFTCTITRLK